MQASVMSRADGKCELCQSPENIQVYQIPESPDLSANCALVLCGRCTQALTDETALDSTQFTFLNQSMWSTIPAVQVVSYRLLHLLNSESWAQDALDMIYLEDDVLAWAQKGLHNNTEATLDVNGSTLKAGDSVTIIKDLDVKGASFTAKRGTPVRNIGLSENPLHIEGKVNGQRIVIIAAYTKKN